MGYTTEFEGKFDFDRKLDDETYNLLRGLNATRRMKRKLDKKYGVEGEFYIDGKGMMGQDDEDNVLDHNQPPKTQPSLWLQWRPTEDRLHLEWDEGEKFYEYVEWLHYIINKILKPKDYILNGNVIFRGEDNADFGTIEIQNNEITKYDGTYKTVRTKKIKQMSEETLDELEEGREYEILFKYSDVTHTIKADNEEEARKIAEEMLESKGNDNPNNDTNCYDIEIEEVEK